MADVVRGLDSLIRHYTKLRDDMRPMLERLTEKATLYVHSQVPDYPPPPSNSTYIRTGTLGRTITTRVESLGTKVVGFIGTNTVYAPYVISDQEVGERGPQAEVHKGRWWTLQGVVRAAKAAVIKIYEDGIEQFLRS
jgi:hypothetical protein